MLLTNATPINLVKLKMFKWSFYCHTFLILETTKTLKNHWDLQDVYFQTFDRASLGHWGFSNGLFYFILFFLSVELIGVTLVNKIARVSGAQSCNPSSVYHTDLRRGQGVQGTCASRGFWKWPSLWNHAPWLICSLLFTLWTEVTVSAVSGWKYVSFLCKWDF